ncbi:MAG TPA: hypothetical protein VGM45_08760 [Gaiellaceae bacterium]|jgi:hypothetical protein
MRPETVVDAFGQLDRTGAMEAVVMVSDPRGWTWEVTGDGDRLTSLTVIPHPGVRLDQKALALVPVGYLHDVAARYLAIVERAVDDGMRIEDALREADRAAGEVVTTDDAPTSEDFAAAWVSTPEVGVGERGTKRTGRRQALADRYGVSVFTIDSWTRRARVEGLIPPVPGKPRGRRAQTPDRTLRPEN